MEYNLSDCEMIIYNLIKFSICKYIFKPLTCSKLDVVLLSKQTKMLIDNKNYDYNSWYSIFKFYLKIDCPSELSNLISYVKNHI